MHIASEKHRAMKRQGRVSPANNQNSITTEFKISKTPDEDLKGSLVKMIDDLRENTA